MVSESPRLDSKLCIILQSCPSMRRFWGAVRNKVNTKGAYFLGSQEEQLLSELLSDLSDHSYQPNCIYLPPPPELSGAWKPSPLSLCTELVSEVARDWRKDRFFLCSPGLAPKLCVVIFPTTPSLHADDSQKPHSLGLPMVVSWSLFLLSSPGPPPNLSPGLSGSVRVSCCPERVARQCSPSSAFIAPRAPISAHRAPCQCVPLAATPTAPPTAPDP